MDLGEAVENEPTPELPFGIMTHHSFDSSSSAITPRASLFPVTPTAKIRGLRGTVRNANIHESQALHTVNESGKFMRQLLAHLGEARGGANVVEGKRFSSLKAVFDHIDKDGNGSIDHDEFKLFLDEIGLDDLSPSELKLLIQCLDVDDDGEISLEELERFVVNHPSSPSSTPSSSPSSSPSSQPRRNIPAVEDGVVVEGIRRALAVVGSEDLMDGFAVAMNKRRHLQRVKQCVERSFAYDMTNAHLEALQTALQKAGDVYELSRIVSDKRQHFFARAETESEIAAAESEPLPLQHDAGRVDDKSEFVGPASAQSEQAWGEFVPANLEWQKALRQTLTEVISGYEDTSTAMGFRALTKLQAYVERLIYDPTIDYEGFRKIVQLTEPSAGDDEGIFLQETKLWDRLILTESHRKAHWCKLRSAKTMLATARRLSLLTDLTDLRPESGSRHGGASQSSRASLDGEAASSIFENAGSSNAASSDNTAAGSSDTAAGSNTAAGSSDSGSYTSFHFDQTTVSQNAIRVGAAFFASIATGSVVKHSCTRSCTKPDSMAGHSEDREYYVVKLEEGGDGDKEEEDVWMEEGQKEEEAEKDEEAEKEEAEKDEAQEGEGDDIKGTRSDNTSATGHGERHEGAKGGEEGGFFIQLAESLALALSQPPTVMSLAGGSNGIGKGAEDRDTDVGDGDVTGVGKHSLTCTADGLVKFSDFEKWVRAEETLGAVKMEIEKVTKLRWQLVSDWVRTAKARAVTRAIAVSAAVALGAARAARASKVSAWRTIRGAAEAAARSAAGSAGAALAAAASARSSAIWARRLVRQLRRHFKAEGRVGAPSVSSPSLADMLGYSSPRHRQRPRSKDQQDHSYHNLSFTLLSPEQSPRHSHQYSPQQSPQQLQQHERACDTTVHDGWASRPCAIAISPFNAALSFQLDSPASPASTTYSKTHSQQMQSKRSSARKSTSNRTVDGWTGDSLHASASTSMQYHTVTKQWTPASSWACYKPALMRSSASAASAASASSDQRTMSGASRRRNNSRESKERQRQRQRQHDREMSSCSGGANGLDSSWLREKRLEPETLLVHAATRALSAGEKRKKRTAAASASAAEAASPVRSLLYNT
jgi:hypothetical protein